MNRLDFDPYLARWIDYITGPEKEQQRLDDLCWALLYALQSIVRSDYLPFIEAHHNRKLNGF